MKKLKLNISNFVSYFDQENFKGGIYPNGVITIKQQKQFFKDLQPADTVFMATFPDGLLLQEQIKNSDHENSN